MAVHQSGRTTPLGQAEERPIGCGPVQTANQTPAEERLGRVARRSGNVQLMFLNGFCQEFMTYMIERISVHLLKDCSVSV